RGIPLEIGGMPDHVHVLARIRPDRSVAEMTRTMKSASSKWVHQTFPASASFAWQAGYAAFSVSESQAGAVRRYIRNQAAHHARLSFKEELISLLRKNRVEFDERYLWD
ncbi:MAG TPA: transposase, partial [Thermoanaerobaculia bacterium]|nr:transposase [Thermoanaerobaculia bacterium]